MSKKKKEIVNRARAKDRPRTSEQLRNSHIGSDKHPCYGKGHEHIFLRGDRYGCCKRCGNEVLT